MGRIIKYILFACCVSLILLVLRFPYSAVEQRMVRECSRLFSPVNIDFGPVGYKFPGSLRIEKIQVAGQNNPEKRFSIDNVVITPSLKNPLTVFAINADMFSGELRGMLVLAGNPGTFAMQDIALSGVSGEMVAPLLDREDRFSGTVQFAGKADGEIVSTGADFSMAGELIIANGYYRPGVRILEKEQVDFNLINLTLGISGETIVIEKGTFDNNQLKSGFEGSIKLSNPWPLWLVDVFGEIEPKKNLFTDDRKLGQIVRRLQQLHKESNIPYSIIGTAENARFRIGRNR